MVNERQRIDAFELWCWRKLMRVPWTARRSNQSILKEVSPEYSLERCWSWSSNSLITWSEELTHSKRPWCWQRSKVRGEGDDRGWDGWMASLTRWIWVWVGDGQGGLACWDSWGRKESDTTERLIWGIEAQPWDNSKTRLICLLLNLLQELGRDCLLFSC